MESYVKDRAMMRIAVKQFQIAALIPMVVFLPVLPDLTVDQIICFLNSARLSNALFRNAVSPLVLFSLVQFTKTQLLNALRMNAVEISVARSFV